MTLHRPISRTRNTKVKRAMGVQAALEWAFRVENAQLELPTCQDVAEEGFGFGLEYVLLQRATLGCQIDGGQHKIGSYTHEDAEVIAATVAGIPDSLGGRRMAIRVAELARAGLTPDWMPGAAPRCVPVDVKRNQHGEHRLIPPLDTAQKIGMQIAHNILRLAVLPDECRLRVLAEDPRRHALVDRLRHDVRSRSGNDVKAHLGGEIEESGEVAHGVRVTVHIGHVRLRLMPQPRDIGGDRVETGIAQQTEPVRPLVNRGAEIVKFPRVNEQRLII